MNWMKFNKTFEIAGATTFVLLAIARIMHLISLETFLWSAAAILLAGIMVGRQIITSLAKRVQELEAGQD